MYYKLGYFCHKIKVKKINVRTFRLNIIYQKERVTDLMSWRVTWLQLFPTSLMKQRRHGAVGGEHYYKLSRSYRIDFCLNELI